MNITHEQLKDLRTVSNSLVENMKEQGIKQDNVIFQQACALANQAIDIEDCNIDKDPKIGDTCQPLQDHMNKSFGR